MSNSAKVIERSQKQSEGMEMGRELRIQIGIIAALIFIIWIVLQRQYY